MARRDGACDAADRHGATASLAVVQLANLNQNPAFLDNVTDPVVKAWSQIVSGYWADLIRETNTSATCPIYPDAGDCEGTFIPLNHTFVIPGGRFREQCEYGFRGTVSLDG